MALVTDKSWFSLHTALQTQELDIYSKLANVEALLNEDVQRNKLVQACRELAVSSCSSTVRLLSNIQHGVSLGYKLPRDPTANSIKVFLDGVQQHEFKDYILNRDKSTLTWNNEADIHGKHISIEYPYDSINNLRKNFEENISAQVRAQLNIKKWRGSGKWVGKNK